MITQEERIYGFTKFWSDAAHYFCYWDRLLDLDWDEVYKEYLPRIMAAEDDLTYYLEMQKVATLLKDGHTGVVMPEHLALPYDMTIGTTYIEGKHILDSVPKQYAQHLYQEILEIDHIDINTYLKEKIYPYMWHERPEGAFRYSKLVYIMHYVQGNDPFEIKTPQGVFTVQKGDKSEEVFGEIIPRHPEFDKMKNLFESETHTIKMTQDNIAYIFIPNFRQGEKLKEEFYNNVDLLKAAKGIIIDVRGNDGGGCTGTTAVAKAFLQGEIIGSTQSVPYFLGDMKTPYFWKDKKTLTKEASHEALALRYKQNYGHMFYKVEEDKRMIEDCPVYLDQPLVILSDEGNGSAGEEFLIHFKGQGRAVIIGTPSMGTNGQPVMEELPGGGYYRICSMQTVLPDGTEYINIGVQPDILVEPTIQDLKNEYDRILDEGLKYLRNK